MGKKGEEWERKEEGGNSGGDRCVCLYACGQCMCVGGEMLTPNRGHLLL